MFKKTAPENALHDIVRDDAAAWPAVVNDRTSIAQADDAAQAEVAPYENDASTADSVSHSERAARAAIACTGIGKSIGTQRVLDAISFSLMPGETMAIAGINGAGKTTLLRCLLDFARADQGSLSIFGRDSHLPQARQRLAWLPERFLPPAHLSGHETLKWLAGLHGQRWTRARSESVFDAFDLPREVLDKRVRHLSKGMTQKLGLAALLNTGCDLLVLDEPMSGLDPIARQTIRAMLDTARARGCSILFTSHAMTDIDRLADRLLVLHQGRVRFLGSMGELRAASGEDDPESAFIACVSPAGVALQTAPRTTSASRTKPATLTE